MIEIALAKRSEEGRAAWMEGYEAGRHIRLDNLQQLIDAAYDRGFKSGYNKRASEETLYTDTDSVIREEDEDA